MKAIEYCLLSIVGASFFGTFGISLLGPADSVCQSPQTSLYADELTQSQDTCKILDERDEFTKSRRVVSGPFRLYNEHFKLRESKLAGFSYSEYANIKETQFAIYFFPEWKNGKKSLCVFRRIHRVQGYMEFPQHDPDPKMMFILANDEVLTLVPYTIEASQLGDGGWLTQRQFFSLSDSTWAMLRDAPPKKVRLRYLGSNRESIFNYDIEIAPENQALFPFALRCLENLQLE